MEIPIMRFSLANPTSKKIKYKVNNVSKTLKNGEVYYHKN